MDLKPFLTIDDVCSELDIHRSTFDRWRKTGRGPRWLKLPNGDVRIPREFWIEWLGKLESDGMEES